MSERREGEKFRDCCPSVKRRHGGEERGGEAEGDGGGDGAVSDVLSAEERAVWLTGSAGTCSSALISEMPQYI